MDGLSLPGAREATTPSEERGGWHILRLDTSRMSTHSESLGFDRGFSVMTPCCIAGTGNDHGPCTRSLASVRVAII
jgi:hypothetical protein